MTRHRKMLGAHPVHDQTGKIHAPTGAKLTPTHGKRHVFKMPKAPKMSKVSKVPHRRGVV